MKIRNILKKLYKKFLVATHKGKTTDKKIVVFESDDWGAERNFSKQNLDKLLKKYPNFAHNIYQKYDILETDEDVVNLKNVLESNKDKNGNPAIFTLNFAMKNIDYKNLDINNLDNLKLISIKDYYKESKNSKNVLKIVKENIGNCFSAQLHGREHINICKLKKEISSGDALSKDALKLNIVGVNGSEYSGMDVLNTSDENSKIMLTEAMQEFKNIFGKTSESFIAPCYTWKKSDEKVLSELGVKYMQGNFFQNKPNKNRYGKIYHPFGRKSKNKKLTYFYRNCNFEPSREINRKKTDEQILDNTMTEIRQAFKNKTPAVICSHRVNYVSGINKEVSEHNLQLLDALLKRIKTEFEDVEFMDTVSMCEEMSK